MSDSNNQQESISGTDGEVPSQSISPSNSSQTRQNLSNVVQMRQQRSPWQIFKSFCFRMLMIYLVTRFIRQPTGRDLKSNVNSTHSVNPHRTYKLKNLYNPGDSIDVYVFVNEEKLYQFRPNEVPTWKIVNFKYVDWTTDGALIKFVEFPISENVQNNGSIYLHVVVTKHGHSIDPADRQKDSPNFSFSKSKRLNKYKRKTYPQTKNLLTNSMGKTDDEKKKTLNIEPIRSHWHSNITISFVDDQSSWRRGHVPPPIDRYLRFEETTGKFYPIVYVNDYWNLLTDYFPINSTVEKLNLTIRLEPIQLWKWEFFISQNARQPWPLNLFADENEDQDVFKRIFLETNFYVLIVTIIVSLVHSIFEFLALKNEIQFWKTRQNFEGLSIRSLTFKIIQSFVVLLYVIDQRANVAVRISVLIGLFIEIWKIRKIFRFQREDGKWFCFIPKYKIFVEKSYQKTKSSEYDRMALKYLSWILFPLVFLSACYQLVFYEQKNWFSFCLSTIYGFFLSFGFIMMTPQLFINYKLKSVDHLPWRMMTYKALNTFIDDLFAFVIEMPRIYRLACFRDDLIFLIYLYQRYIYPVDRKRLNEFGQTGENESNHVEEKETNLSEHLKSD